MYLNLFHPKQCVQSCIDRPDSRIALLLVLLPAIVSAILSLAIGFPANFLQTGLALVRSVIGWIGLSAVFFIVLYLVKGNRLQGKFAGIASALSLLWLVNLVMVIIGFAFVPLIFSPSVLNEAKLVASSENSLGEFAQNAGNLIDSNPQAVNLGIGIIAVLAGVLLLLFSCYLVYQIVRDLYESNFSRNLIITVILVVAWAYLANWLFVLI